MPKSNPRPSLALWTLARDGDGATASREGDTVSAPHPADLWKAISSRSDGRVVHIAERDARAAPAAMARCAGAMERDGIDTMLARVRYADGTLSPRIKQVELVRYLQMPPGALLTGSAALMRAAETMPRKAFDDFWSYDLANTLALDGLAVSSDEILADLPGRAPSVSSPLMPFARATHLQTADRDDSSILVYGHIQATAAFYFDALPLDLRARLRFLRPGDLSSDIGWLASAGLVIVLRDFEHMFLSGAHELLVELGVPYFWFTDDDLMALGTDVPAFAVYDEALVRRFVADAAGVIATSPMLAASLSRFHDVVVLWPCLYDTSLSQAAPSPFASDLRIGAFGGGFRRRSFLDHVCPALRDLGRERAVTVFANAELARGASDVTLLPYRDSFRGFVQAWRRLGLNVIVHPYGASANISNKSPASLLVAAYLGAVPVVGEETAYTGVTEEAGVLKAAPDSNAWLAALNRLADPDENQRLYARLEAWCRVTFDPEKARPAVETCLRWALPGDADSRAVRWQDAGRSRAFRKVMVASPGRRKRLSRLWRSIKRHWR